MRRVFDDYSTKPKIVRNIYDKAYENEPKYKQLKERIYEASKAMSSKPKVMIANLGQDGHDRGEKVIASAFGDMGFDVLAGPLFQTPEEAADMAIEADVK